MNTGAGGGASAGGGTAVPGQLRPPEPVPTTEVRMVEPMRTAHVFRLPESLAELWRTASANQPIATLNIMQPERPGAKAKVTLYANEALVNNLPPEQRAQASLWYHVNMSGNKVKISQRLFSTAADGSDVRIDALVAQTATLRPRRDAAYKRRLQDRVERAKHDPKKRRTKEKVLASTSQQTGEFRGFRIDKDREAEVAALERFPDVLRAFDHQQYWSKKELIARVNQTDAEITATLRKCCIYIQRGDNRAKYELKPEYKGTLHPDVVANDDDDD